MCSKQAWEAYKSKTSAAFTAQEKKRPQTAMVPLNSVCFNLESETSCNQKKQEKERARIAGGLARTEWIKMTVTELAAMQVSQKTAWEEITKSIQPEPKKNSCEHVILGQDKEWQESAASSPVKAPTRTRPYACFSPITMNPLQQLLPSTNRLFTVEKSMQAVTLQEKEMRLATIEEEKHIPVTQCIKKVFRKKNVCRLPLELYKEISEDIDPTIHKESYYAGSPVKALNHNKTRAVTIPNGGKSGAVRIWDTHTKKGLLCILTASELSSPVLIAAVSNNGQFVATGSTDRYDDIKDILLWDGIKGTYIEGYTYYEPVKNISFSYNDSELNVYNKDNETQTRRRLRRVIYLSGNQ